ncbi:hypothetical protein JCM10449v2_006421 [Rhodotorula kratochvilovae]
MDAAAIHERTTLLTQLNELYAWLRKSARGAHHKRNFESAQKSFTTDWPALLPHEREEAVDLLLSAYCRHCAEGEFDWAEIKFREVCEEIGYHGIENADAVKKAEGFVDAVVQLYRCSIGGEHLPAVERWQGEFLGPEGLSRLKMQRIDQDLLDAILHQLHQLVEHLRAREILPPAHLLPSVDSVFAAAHVTTQSAEDRYQIFSLFVEHAVDLYRAPIGPHPPNEEHVAHMRTAVDTLARINSLVHFTNLPLAQQCGAVHHGRVTLFFAIEERETRAFLPPVNELTHRFFDPLLLPEYRLGGAMNPLVAESLAHSHRQISDHKARRYYGTTARAWAARTAQRRW